MTAVLADWARQANTLLVSNPAGVMSWAALMILESSGETPKG